MHYVHLNFVPRLVHRRSLVLPPRRNEPRGTAFLRPVRKTERPRARVLADASRVSARIRLGDGELRKCNCGALDYFLIIIQQSAHAKRKPETQRASNRSAVTRLRHRVFFLRASRLVGQQKRRFVRREVVRGILQNRKLHNPLETGRWQRANV